MKQVCSKFEADVTEDEMDFISICINGKIRAK